MVRGLTGLGNTGELGRVRRVVLEGHGLLREVRPQIYTKGGDYTVESLNAEERGALKEVAAEIKILPLVPGKSTTAVIEKMECGNRTDAKE